MIGTFIIQVDFAVRFYLKLGEDRTKNMPRYHGYATDTCNQCTQLIKLREKNKECHANNMAKHERMRIINLQSAQTPFSVLIPLKKELTWTLVTEFPYVLL